jgi:hypothetical protein
MADGGKPGGFYSGLGQPGVRETKVVGESSEVKIPRKQFMELWLFTFLAMLLGFACLKLLIVSRGDWSLLVGVVTIVAIPIFAVFFERRIAYRFFPNVYNDILNAIYRILHGDNLASVILFLFVVSCIGLLAVGFYIAFIVPQITLILHEQNQYAFVFMAFASLIVALLPYYQFNKRQLTDSLRDSDTGYAQKAMEIEEARRIRKEEAVRALMDAGVQPESPDQSGYYTPIMFHSSSSSPTKFASDAKNRFRDATRDFLEGIDRGDWGTGERTWRNDPVTGVKWLPNSKYKVMDMGGVIRDELIKNGYARWKNDRDHSAGWELLFSTEEIMEQAFRDGNMVSTQNNGGDDETD